MCAYCMIGDWQFRHNPPWDRGLFQPLIPAPLPDVPVNPWSVDQLKEYLDLLERVKALEDQLGCPCEPNKADYIRLFKERIEALEKKVADDAR